MARTIIKNLDGKLEKESLRKLTEEIRKVGSVAELSDFLSKFMTAGEKKLILRRLAVIDMINHGKKYREIKEILEVSNNTISNARDIIEGRGYGNDPNRKRKYSPLVRRSKKKPYRLKYKGADGLGTLLDSF